LLFIWKWFLKSERKGRVKGKGGKREKEKKEKKEKERQCNNKYSKTAEEYQ
jgi:hypothetical protein